MIFRTRNKFNSFINPSIFLLSFIILVSYAGNYNLFAQSETAKKRFITQEDRELGKIKINRVKNRTAVTYQKGSFAKVSTEEAIK